MQDAFCLRPRAFWRTLLFTTVLGALASPFAPTVRAAENATKRSYDVPADEAERSLNTFSKQSDRGIVAGANALQGVRTNAVKGELTADEALTQMLAGTDLIATEDDRGDGFAIRRKNTDPNGQMAALTTVSDRPMNRNDSIGSTAPRVP